MSPKIFSAILIFLSPLLAYNQQAIWVHKSFSKSGQINTRYSQDTVRFDANAPILGMVYYPNAEDNQMQISLHLRLANKQQSAVCFDLKSITPGKLKWHPVFRRYYQKMFEKPHWYSFEISPKPSVATAYDGVHFLELLYPVAQKKQAVLLSYRVSTDSIENTCWIDFQNGNGLFAPLWEKLGRYQKLLQEKNAIEAKQQEALKKFSPYGFEEVNAWACRKFDMKDVLEDCCVMTFAEVERLKIITENIPDSISKHLKRELKRLLTMDIALLEMPEGKAKKEAIQHKNSLVKELSLYPELNSIMEEYNLLFIEANSCKRTETEYAGNLEVADKLYQPYEQAYKYYVELNRALNGVCGALVEFE